MTRRLFQGGSRTVCRSRGFTLVELLVVITIIGILMSLLLPAVSAARASAQKATCMNNIKQIGLGALAHEHQYGWFPGGGWGNTWAGDPNLGYSVNQPGGFFYNLLPFIDQANLWAYGQSGQSATTVLQAAQMPVAVYNCPSRRPLGVLPTGSGVKFYSSSSNDKSMAGVTSSTMLPRTDYAANGGDADKGAGPPIPTAPTTVANGQSPTFWNSYFKGGPQFNGICAPHSQVKAGAITRGMSYVMLAGEKYLNPDCYLNGQDAGDNATWDMGYDANTIRWGGGGISSNSMYLPTQDTPGIPNSSSFGSTHVDGFGMVFCDGSTRNLNFTIDPTMYGYMASRFLYPSDTADLIDDAKF